jgi:hypothetical protein
MKKNYFLIMIVLGLCSCQKEGSQTAARPAEVDVYVAGYTSDDANSPYPVFNPYGSSGEQPTYWKNGTLVQLDYGDYRGNHNNKSGRASAIAVSGNNVYVAGYGTWFSPTSGQLPYGVIWKNGIPLDRDSMNLYETYEIYSLAVANNDTYMVGWGGRTRYWKNENPIELTPGYSPTTLNILATATSIAVSGNDVYVSGAQQQQLSAVGGWSNVIAEYWKNGNLVKLTDGSKDAYTSSIAVSGTDVFVAGVEDSVAKYWKNGNLVNLTDGSKAAYTASIAVAGTGVYVAGTQWDGDLIQYHNGYTVYQRNPIAKYWKNGQPVNLTDGSRWAEAKSIVVSGTDVYVAGFEGGVAKYWKNGSPVILGDVSKKSEAYSIFLVPK